MLNGRNCRPGDLVDPLAGDEPAGGLDHPLGPGVAVVDRVAEQDIAPADEPEVDAPGIDGHPIEPRALGGGLAQGDLHLFEEAQDVPVERIEQPDRPVREPVDLFEREPFAVELPEQAPAALGAEVEGEIIGRVRHEEPRRVPSPEGSIVRPGEPQS